MLPVFEAIGRYTTVPTPDASDLSDSPYLLYCVYWFVAFAALEVFLYFALLKTPLVRRQMERNLVNVEPVNNGSASTVDAGVSEKKASDSSDDTSSARRRKKSGTVEKKVENETLEKKKKKTISLFLARRVAASYCACFIHAFGTSIGAIGVIVLGWTGPHWWRSWLAFSVGYWCADCIHHALKPDISMVAHHLVVGGCNFFAGHWYTAVTAGAGTPEFAVWLSAAGYLMELSTVFLCLRWFSKMLRPTRSAYYSMITIVMLITWLPVRCLFAPYVLIFQVLPRLKTYYALGSLAFGGFAVFGWTVIIALNFKTTHQMLRARNIKSKKDLDVRGTVCGLDFLSFIRHNGKPVRQGLKEEVVLWKTCVEEQLTETGLL
eukprot:g838.t1